MSGILDVVAAVRELLEPGGQVARDESGAEPFVWEPNTFYAYPTAGRLAESPFESGPGVRQDFSVTAVYVAPATNEESRQARDAEVSALLDEKRAAYLDLVRANRTTPTWHHITAAERPAPRTLQTRAVALELTGYRLRS